MWLLACFTCFAINFEINWMTFIKRHYMTSWIYKKFLLYYNLIYLEWHQRFLYFSINCYYSVRSLIYIFFSSSLLFSKEIEQYFVRFVVQVFVKLDIQPEKIMELLLKKKSPLKTIIEDSVCNITMYVLHMWVLT